MKGSTQYATKVEVESDGLPSSICSCPYEFDCKILNSGNGKAVVARVRREIRDIEEEPGWQNYWSGEGFTPDYSRIRKNLAVGA